MANSQDITVKAESVGVPLPSVPKALSPNSAPPRRKEGGGMRESERRGEGDGKRGSGWGRGREEGRREKRKRKGICELGN